MKLHTEADATVHAGRDDRHPRRMPRREIPSDDPVVASQRSAHLRCCDIAPRPDQPGIGKRLLGNQRKTGQPVYVPLPTEAIEALRHATQTRPTTSGRASNGAQTATTNWRADITKLCRKAGVPGGKDRTASGTPSRPHFSQGRRASRGRQRAARAHIDRYNPEALFAVDRIEATGRRRGSQESVGEGETEARAG